MNRKIINGLFLSLVACILLMMLVTTYFSEAAWWIGGCLLLGGTFFNWYLYRHMLKNEEK